MQGSVVISPKHSIDQEDFNTFLTEAPPETSAPLKTVASNANTNYTPRGFPTKLGLVGEVDVINGILDKVRAKTRKINLDSPRTKQALALVGVQKEECIIKKFENFEVNVKNEKMQKLLYTYYVGHVNDVITEVLEKRESLKTVKKGRTMSLAECAFVGYGGEKASPDRTTARSPGMSNVMKSSFATMDYGEKVNTINERNEHKVQTIERQAMLYLESERNYLKKLDKMKGKSEKVDSNRKELEARRLEEVKQKREKYLRSVEKAKKLNEPEEEDDDDHDESKKLGRIMTAKDFRQLHLQNFPKIEEHRVREQKFVEAQKTVDARVERRDFESDLRSSSVQVQLDQKSSKFQNALSKILETKKTSTGNWVERNNRAKELMISTDAEESTELYTKFAEKIQRYEVQTAKNESQRVKLFEERRKQEEEKLKEIKYRLNSKEKEFDHKEAEFKEKIVNQTERLSQFHTTKASNHNQNTDLNKYRLQRSYIHFGRVLSDDTHKANVIMSKNKTWKEAYDKKQLEKEAIKNVSMQNQFKLKAEKESLTVYLDQVSKLQQSKEIIAGKLKKTQIVFNVKPMAEYISDNFVKKPQKQNRNKSQESFH